MIAERAVGSVERIDFPPPRLSVGPHATRFFGCRILHEVSNGLANVRIHAGTAVDAHRDEPVQFLLAREDLDRVIAHLTGIRAEIAASEVRHG